MQVFRSCPAFPGYSAALCGTVRREPWVARTKLGNPSQRPASILKRFGPAGRYVYIQGAPVRWERLVADAWPCRVPTIAEWQSASAPQPDQTGVA